MNKSAIYATMKTSNLVVGFLLGIGLVHVGNHLGMVAATLGVPVVILAAFGWGNVVYWVFKKFGIEDF